MRGGEWNCKVTFCMYFICVFLSVLSEPQKKFFVVAGSIIVQLLLEISSEKRVILF